MTRSLNIAGLSLFFACNQTIEPPVGPDPDFSIGDVFISMEDIKSAYDAGAAFYFLDARPQVDYELSHITGALSVPFFDVEEIAPTLPEDVWYICYCACPHAESGVVCEHLLNNGHQKAAILDEGFLAWQDAGYPTESGP